MLFLPTVAIGLAALAAGQAPTYSTFTGLIPNQSVNGQGSWISTGPWDEEVVDIGGGDIRWRVSNAVTSGSFGNMPFAPATDLYAGETTAIHVFDAQAAVSDTFYGSFEIQSVVAGPQPGLALTISPDDGAGSRMSFLRVVDSGVGLDVVFFDSQANHPTSNPNGGFVSTTVATGLAYGSVHRVAFDIQFVDGVITDGGGFIYGNDIVKIFVNGNLAHTGTTWESYYRTTNEGQVPPTVRAVDTLMFRISGTAAPTVVGNGFYVDNVFVSVKCPNDFQGFETDISGWDIFSSAVFFPDRVASGTNGVTSASGGWHAVAAVAMNQVPAGNWGGYSGNCGCPSTSCAMAQFPTHGYSTSVDVYLDMNVVAADDTRFDYSSAINQPNGAHRRDFIFNAGFYSAGNGTLPGAGVNRFIISASNNSGQPPFNVPALPIAITTTGWYTFEHQFYSNGLNQLAVLMTIKDANGVIQGQWTRSDPSDIINVTVGGNRYAWFPTNGFTNLAFDNATRSQGGEGKLSLTATNCQDDVSPAPGYQISVDLKMSDLTSFASGFQAFVGYNTSTFAFRSDLSSYTMSPFPMHISPMAGVANNGLLELDGSVVSVSPGTLADATLATLVFDVLPAGCVTTSSIDFSLFGNMNQFSSELSHNGVPLETVLQGPGTVALDDTAPILSGVPSNITVPATAVAMGNNCLGATVTFTAPTALDNCDPAPVVACVPASGTAFPVGTTLVTCTATDSCGNASVQAFTVEVQPVNIVNVEIILEGNEGGSTRCIRIVTNTCASGSGLVTFTDHDMNTTTPARGMASIAIPCGTYNTISVKDEQHTLWASTAVSVVGGQYQAAGAVSLAGGDTDNDGDVDINDVTLLLSQFGQIAHPGGCAWTGVRDADFSNNGAIGSDDYNFFSSSWLTSTSAICSIPLVAQGGKPTLDLELRRRVEDPITRQADLNGDGWVDSRDVRVLEHQLGLAPDLSIRMARR